MKMEGSSISLPKLSQEETHIPITVIEEKEQDQWEDPREADLLPELRELKNQTSSTVIIFLPKQLSEDKRVYFLQEGHFFPPEFLEVLFKDLNGTFYCNYTTDADERYNVIEHVSWSCFKIKNIESPIKYDWIQPAVFVKWYPKISQQTVFCLGPPEVLLKGLQAKKPAFASRQYNPFVWHTLFTQGMIPLYDNSIWSMRDTVRRLETSRTEYQYFPEHFPSLNDVGRHLLHSNEILEVARHTVQSLIDEQTRWRTEHKDLVDNNRNAWIHYFQKLVYLAKTLHSLHARSRSLNTRLHNEISLSVALANQSDNDRKALEKHRHCSASSENEETENISTLKDDARVNSHPKNDETQPFPLASIDNLQSVAFSDSGYASVTNANHNDKQLASIQEDTQGSDEVRIETIDYAPTESDLATDTRYPMNSDTDEIQSIYSEVDSIPGSIRENYITEFAEDILGKIYSTVGYHDSRSMERLYECLSSLLKSFALRIGHNAKTQEYRDVMVFVSKHKKDIAESVRDRFLDEDRSPNPALNLDEKMRYWQERLEDAEEPSVSDVIDYDSEATIPENSQEGARMPPYRNVIMQTTAYNWLLARVDRELRLETPEGSAVRSIASRIHNELFSLPPFRKISRNQGPQVCKMRFEIEWDPIAFFKEQEYEEEPPEVMNHAITLTGTPSNAQALTCAEYMEQTWPLVGCHTLWLVSEMVSSACNSQASCKLPDGTTLSACIRDSKTIVEAIGTGDYVAEIGEQLAWLGGALRSSEHDIGVAYCTPSICEIHLNAQTQEQPWIEASCKINFSMVSSERGNSMSSNGQCWFNLFRNPVVVGGFPVHRRDDYNTGLEIPLNIMAMLARAQRVTTYAGQLLIKGFSTMLIPTKQVAGMVVWHLIFNESGDHISFGDIRAHRISALKPGDLTIAQVESSRHVLGWCSNVRSYTGAFDANYAIKWSSLQKPHEGCAFDKITISGGNFVTAGVSCVIGKKDKPVQIKTRDDYVAKLKWISKKFVIFYDVEDRRGWLVDGASALLHLVRASVQHDRHDEFNSIFLFNPNELQEPKGPHTGKASAIAFLTNESNKKLKLYSKADELWDEETVKPDGGQEDVSKRKTTYFRLKDRVEQIYYILEQIISYQAQACSQDGVGFRVKYTPRRQLEGFDFMDVATDEDPIWPRVATIQATGKGWVDFARAIHAITLFGQGFGELLKPVDGEALCPTWSEAPKGKDWLTVCVSDLKEILKRRGSTKTRPWRLVDDLYWHKPDQLFEACPCVKGKEPRSPTNTKQHADRVQVLLPARFPNLWSRGFTCPGPLQDRGAVIFGHSWKFPLRWNDHGETPVEDDTDVSSPPADDGDGSVFHDSGIGSSVGSRPLEVCKENALSTSDVAIVTETIASSNSGHTSPIVAITNQERNSLPENIADSGAGNKHIRKQTMLRLLRWRRT